VPPATAPDDAGKHAHTLYPTPCRVFQLGRLAPRPGIRIEIPVRSAEILLCTEGQIQVLAGTDTTILTRGNACAIPAAASSYTVSGSGGAFRAGLPEGS
jgi:mannose-6-phosphate isomerase class I